MSNQSAHVRNLFLDQSILKPFKPAVAQTDLTPISGTPFHGSLLTSDRESRILPVMEQKFNPETARVYHFRYMREYRAICVLWGLLSIIWCILNLVAFVQPQWIGDTPTSPGFGHVGVFQHCYPDNSQGIYVCSGSFTTFDSILNDSFRATTFFVGVSALLMLITVAALLLFFCFKKTFVFYFCGIMELISGKSSIC